MDWQSTPRKLATHTSPSAHGGRFIISYDVPWKKSPLPVTQCPSQSFPEPKEQNQGLQDSKTIFDNMTIESFGTSAPQLMPKTEFSKASVKDELESESEFLPAHEDEKSLILTSAEVLKEPGKVVGSKLVSVGKQKGLIPRKSIFSSSKKLPDSVLNVDQMKPCKSMSKLNKPATRQSSFQGGEEQKRTEKLLASRKSNVFPSYSSDRRNSFNYAEKATSKTIICKDNKTASGAPVDLQKPKVIRGTVTPSVSSSVSRIVARAVRSAVARPSPSPAKLLKKVIENSPPHLLSPQSPMVSEPPPTSQLPATGPRERKKWSSSTNADVEDFSKVTTYQLSAKLKNLSTEILRCLGVEQDVVSRAASESPGVPVFTSSDPFVSGAIQRLEETERNLKNVHGKTNYGETKNTSALLQRVNKEKH